MLADLIRKETLIKCLKKNKDGLTITELVHETSFSRSKVRSIISFLFGLGQITERKIGMAKLYKIKKSKRRK